MKKPIFLILSLFFLAGCTTKIESNALSSYGKNLQEIDHGQFVKESQSEYVYGVMVGENTVVVTLSKDGISSEFLIRDANLDVNFIYHGCNKSIQIISIFMDGEQRDDLNEQLANQLQIYLKTHISKEAHTLINDYCAIIKGA